MPVFHRPEERSTTEARLIPSEQGPERPVPQAGRSRSLQCQTLMENTENSAIDAAGLSTYFNTPFCLDICLDKG